MYDDENDDDRDDGEGEGRQRSSLVSFASQSEVGQTGPPSTFFSLFSLISTNCFWTQEEVYLSITIWLFVYSFSPSSYTSSTLRDNLKNLFVLPLRC
jgi:hypothetical protein